MAHTHRLERVRPRQNYMNEQKNAKSVYLVKMNTKHSRVSFISSPNYTPRNDDDLPTASSCLCELVTSPTRTGYSPTCNMSVMSQCRQTPCSLCHKRDPAVTLTLRIKSSLLWQIGIVTQSYSNPNPAHKEISTVTYRDCDTKLL